MREVTLPRALKATFSKVLRIRLLSCISFIVNLTVHFWAPTFKWGITMANIADMSKPVDKISVPQQTGVCGASFID